MLNHKEIMIAMLQQHNMKKQQKNWQFILVPSTVLDSGKGCGGIVVLDIAENHSQMQTTQSQSWSV